MSSAVAVVLRDLQNSISSTNSLLCGNLAQASSFTAADGKFVKGQGELGCPEDGDQLDLKIVRDVIDALTNSIVAEWHCGQFLRGWFVLHRSEVDLQGGLQHILSVGVGSGVLDKEEAQFVANLKTSLLHTGVSLESRDGLFLSFGRLVLQMFEVFHGLLSEFGTHLVEVFLEL